MLFVNLIEGLKLKGPFTYLGNFRVNKQPTEKNIK